MLSPFSFCRRRLPSTMTISRGIRPHIVPSSSSASPSFCLLGQFASFSKDCASPVKLPLLCYHSSSYAGSGTINFRQTRFSAGSSSIFAGIYFNKKLYRTHTKATETTKASMLRKLEKWLSYPNLRKKQIKRDFNLPRVFHILDGIFFEGRLRDRVAVEWKDPKEMDCLSRIGSTSDVRQRPCPLIEVSKPLTSGPWTLAIIRARLDALLYKMIQIYFVLYCRDSQQLNKRAARRRWSSSFKKLLREVKQEADRIFEGLPRP